MIYLTQTKVQQVFARKHFFPISVLEDKILLLHFKPGGHHIFIYFGNFYKAKRTSVTNSNTSWLMTLCGIFVTARKRSLRRLCFYRCLSFCPQGGCVWLLGGACMVARGHVWLLPGGVHGCSWGGMHGCSGGGVCVVFSMRYGQ